ncbi:hypothetical protein [Elizabethkingia bruuniana]|uniref:hypothetical protein n=1 Tax=Elizabethkingia bruuniana TaxID=1756149 RepID=UPI00241D4102|nr:hypothetical protein [Elizabethkingia bruuniana]
MKTEQLKNFEANLSELNDCYSHYIFVWEQFSLDQANTIKKYGKKMTTEIFDKNSNSGQFNVSLDYLSQSHDETQNLILKSIYQLAYGYFENYLIQLHKFAQSLDPTIKDRQQKLENNEADEKTGDIEDNKVFEKVFNRLKIDIPSSFEPLELKTLDYIRLRRNRITHRATSAEGTIVEITNNYGKKINDFWDNHLRHKRYKIDFSIKRIDNFDKNELFDFLNIYRYIAIKINNLFIEKIGHTVLVEYFFYKFVETHGQKMHNFKDDRKKAKFKMYCKVEFGYEISEYELGNVKF